MRPNAITLHSLRTMVACLVMQRRHMLAVALCQCVADPDQATALAIAKVKERESATREQSATFVATLTLVATRPRAQLDVTSHDPDDVYYLWEPALLEFVAHLHTARAPGSPVAVAALELLADAKRSIHVEQQARVEFVNDLQAQLCRRVLAAAMGGD